MRSGVITSIPPEPVADFRPGERVDALFFAVVPVAPAIPSGLLGCFEVRVVEVVDQLPCAQPVSSLLAQTNVLDRVYADTVYPDASRRAVAENREAPALGLQDDLLDICSHPGPEHRRVVAILHGLGEEFVLRRNEDVCFEGVLEAVEGGAG